MAEGSGREKAAFYRREAAECRKQADEAVDQPDRHGCLCLARHYERQARLLDLEALKRNSPNVALISERQT